MYTHHQKSVVCDAPDPCAHDGRRKLIAYVGGLDLTGGRYDTPEHHIFKTLKTDHNDDFRNSNAKSTPATTGPREPWHDIHCRVEGPIARDVLENFVERWVRQGEGMPPLVDDNFCRQINPQAVAECDDPSKEWNVQMIRHAKNFIYIENQFFMGSAFQWAEDFNVLCNHTIPVEITSKIKDKMFAGERFTAYFVIPMWPEGDPT